MTAEAVRIAGSNVAAQQIIIGEFYGHYEVWYNAVALGLQMFVVSRVFRYLVFAPRCLSFRVSL